MGRWLLIVIGIAAIYEQLRVGFVWGIVHDVENESVRNSRMRGGVNEIRQINVDQNDGIRADLPIVMEAVGNLLRIVKDDEIVEFEKLDQITKFIERGVLKGKDLNRLIINILTRISHGSGLPPFDFPSEDDIGEDEMTKKISEYLNEAIKDAELNDFVKCLYKNGEAITKELVEYFNLPPKFLQFDLNEVDKKMDKLKSALVGSDILDNLRLFMFGGYGDNNNDDVKSTLNARPPDHELLCFRKFVSTTKKFLSFLMAHF